MMVLVAYDVASSTQGGAKRLRKVAKACVNYGQRVQFSLFECAIDPADWVKLKNTLENVIDRKSDSLRYYYLGANYKRKVEHIGAKPSFDIDAPLIV
ncbi:MAG: CRISPR-associated endonuclease Cas2 [Helicobacteraceae bacterium]|jgi:CRISPR-associated protein Cas2|nr:CRISPR-associated endonuclease Cas2 [Helicobacteraceae bacterium]